MQSLRKIGFIALLFVCMPQSQTQAGVRIGIGIGLPFPCYGYYGYPYYYAPPYAVYPPSVVYAPNAAPPATVYQPGYTPTPAPANAPERINPLPNPVPDLAAPTQASASIPVADHPGEVDAVLQRLTNGDDQGRAATAIQLGRSRDGRAVAPLTRAMEQDRSPVVREAAARGLGLIAAPSSLPALQYAAQADDDRDVRKRGLCGGRDSRQSSAAVSG